MGLQDYDWCPKQTYFAETAPAAAQGGLSGDAALVAGGLELPAMRILEYTAKNKRRSCRYGGNVSRSHKEQSQAADIKRPGSKIWLLRLLFAPQWGAISFFDG